MEPDRQKPKKAAKIFFAPLIGLNWLLAALLEKALGEDYGGGVTGDDILRVVDAGEESGAIEEDSAEMISNVFEFDEMKVSDVMTHRVNIVGVEAGTKLDDIIYIALDEGFSRIPVYKGSIDKIIGIIIVKDLLCLVGGDRHLNFGINDFLREVIFIPESCPCRDAFNELTAKKTGMAVVVDEYGGTAGILTLEDLIEAVMGNIQDEYDEEEDEITAIGKEKYEIGGETDPEDVLELFGYELPEDHEYDTIAGFVADLLGYIPEEADLPVTVDYEDVKFVVVEAEDNFITKIKAIRHEKQETEKPPKEKEKKEK
ncbi:MAG: CBS domain-containing protein [Oscillospiraceae bacterium]|jgi:putative hemolysin|nr:CBS domain-containing protein [Oscillospiraceae bacterium]